MNGVSNVIIVLPLLLAHSGMALGQPPETFAAAKRLAAADPRGHQSSDHRLLRLPLRPHRALRRRSRPRRLRPDRAQERKALRPARMGARRARLVDR